MKLPEELEIVLLILSPRDQLRHLRTLVILFGWVVGDIYIHRWKFKAGWFTWKKSNWKGTSSEPNLHFGVQDVDFPGWHVKLLRPCFYMRPMTQSSYARFDSILMTLRLLAMFNPRNLVWNGMIYLYDLILEISCGYVLMFYIHECANSTLDEAWS